MSFGSFVTAISVFAVLFLSLVFRSHYPQQTAPAQTFNLRPDIIPSWLPLALPSSPYAANWSPSSSPQSGLWPDELVVTRTQNSLNDPNAPPFSEAITARNLAKLLYIEIEESPTVYACGDLPIIPVNEYELVFYTDGTTIESAGYAPRSCGGVDLSDGRNTSDNSFENDLQQALGLTDHQFFGFH